MPHRPDIGGLDNEENSKQNMRCVAALFAINHDNSDSPYWFMLLDITGDVSAG
jgi:hypothetical protein